MVSPTRLVLALCSLLLPLTAGAQPPAGAGGRGQQVRPGAAGRAAVQAEPPRGTSVMRGAIVTAEGSPLRRAQVRASAPGAGTRTAITDAQGRFEIRDLAAGRYTVSAAKAGFVGLQFGQRRPSESGTPIEVGDGQMVDKLIIALPRGSVISGRITDEFGEPVANAAVSAMRYAFQAGARRLVADGSANSRDTTDDQGQFRLFGLQPGEFVISATVRGAGPGDAADPTSENTGYAPTYYPGTGNVAEAQRVTVGLAQEQSGVMFSLVATRLVRVTGAVLSSQGAAATSGIVLLTPAGARIGGGALQQSAQGRIEQGGQFRITNVPPGRYVAQVRTAVGGRGGPALRLGEAGEFGRQDVTVGNEDLNGLVLVTSPPGRITGRIVTDGASTSTLRPQQVTLTARAVDVDLAGPGGGNAQTRLNEDWTFEIGGVVDPRLLRANVPQGWALKAITLSGQDITDTPLDVPPGQTVAGVQVVVTDKLTELSGRVVDSRGTAVTDVTVIAFPADAALWTFQSRFVRTARPDVDGRYVMRGLPPYDKYLVVAVQGLEDGQAGDPDYLATIREAATSSSLTEGQTKVLDLRWSAR